MFKSRHGSGWGGSANRWLIVAGAGLVILAFVARMLLDIGHTKVSDLAGVLRPDTANTTDTTLPAPVPAPADSVSAAPEAADTPGSDSSRCRYDGTVAAIDLDPAESERTPDGPFAG